MWKHKALEMIDFYDNISNAHDIDTRFMVGMKDYISKSTVFYFGDVDQYNLILSYPEGKDIEDFLHIEKTPFPDMFVESFVTLEDGTTQNCGVYYHNDEDCIMFVPFWWNSEYGKKLDEFSPVILWKYDDKWRYLSVDKHAKAYYESCGEEKHYIIRNLCVAAYACCEMVKVLNCKNVSIETVQAPEKLNIKRVKKGKVPIEEYKILKIERGSVKKKTSNVVHKYGFSYSQNSMALHVCRGHFKEYTEDAPLLGKFTGRFWWQPQVRGHAKNGVVVKDYEIVKE